MSPDVSSFSAAFLRVSWPAKLCVVLLAGFVAALSVRLWPDWLHNPDLSHGLFMPVVFVILLREARTTARPRWLGASAATDGAVVALLSLGLLALFAAGLYAAALDWTHAVVNFTLTAALALLLGAGLVALASNSARLVPCNWNALVAVGLWLLCAPIPPGTYTRLTLGLQLWVSENVLRALHLLGIAAERHGNIIELARGAVGIEEACSGVRSLISCVFAGLFFSASLVRRPWARALVIGLAVPLALGMNFIRSLTLTLLANAGINIAGTWHDATGFAVLGVTAVLLGGLALLLERDEKKSAITDAPEAPAPAGFQIPALTGALIAALALVIFFVANTHPSVHPNSRAPDLAAVLPPAPAGWQAASTNLYEFRDALQTDRLAQRTYATLGPRGPVRIILYLAYWRPGQASVSLVASHTPDACWPGSGWAAQPVAQPRASLTVGPRRLAEAEARFFTLGDDPQHVWFWHLYDGKPIAYRDPYSATELLRIAWRYGFRHDGDQLFVRVSSNRPWTEIAGEPLLAEFFANTKALGL
jgi:exosortase